MKIYIVTHLDIEPFTLSSRYMASAFVSEESAREFMSQMMSHGSPACIKEQELLGFDDWVQGQAQDFAKLAAPGIEQAIEKITNKIFALNTMRI